MTKIDYVGDLNRSVDDPDNVLDRGGKIDIEYMLQDRTRILLRHIGNKGFDSSALGFHFDHGR